MRLVRKRKISSFSPLDIMISPNFLTSTLSIEEVPRVSQTRDKANHIRGYRMVWQRAASP